MFCKNCGKEIDDLHKKCPYCGIGTSPEITKNQKISRKELEKEYFRGVYHEL